MNKHEVVRRALRARAVGVGLLVIFLFTIGAIAINLVDASKGEWLAFSVTLAGLFFAIYIAYVQDGQLHDLAIVSARTEQTAKKLGVDAAIQVTVDRFLGRTKTIHPSFTCFFPVQFQSKPLPLINSGDYHALRVLSTRLGSEQLELAAITRDWKPGKHSTDGNSIFLCSPTANPALGSKWPAVDLSNGTADQRGFEELDFPAWFAYEALETVPTDSESARPRLRIRVFEDQNDINSEADDLYRRAAEIPPGETFEEFYKPQRAMQTDYGILARINDGTKTWLVIAGIHQFGTWIAGEFLDRLLMDESVEFSERMLEPEDFLAIVWGDFEIERLRVADTGILRNCFWQRKDAKWERVRAPSVRN